jgi:outer membrane protein, heavy metal efflux system
MRVRAHQFSAGIAIAATAALVMPPKDTRANEAAGCQHLTEQNLVACVLNANLVVQRERAGVRVGEARVEAARPWLPSNPQLSAGIAFRTSSPTEAAATNWSVGLQQELPLTGRAAARTAAAEGELVAQRWRTVASVRESAQRAWAAYFDVLYAERDLALAQRIERAVQSLATSTRARAEKGLVATIDADVAENLVSKYTQLRIQAELRMETSRAALTALVGLDPSQQSIRTSGDLNPLTNSVVQARALLNAHAERPEVRALRADSQVWRAQALVATRQQIPNVTVNVTAQNDGLTNQKTLGIGLSLPIPLPQPVGRTFTGERGEATAQAMRAALDADRLQRENRLALTTALATYEARTRELAAYSASQTARTEALLTELASEIAAGRLAMAAALVTVSTLTEFLRTQLQAQFAVCTASLEVARAAGIAPEHTTP